MPVALTFDAEFPDKPGSWNQGTETILDRLREADVQATFFVQGRWADTYPGLVARMVREHHEVGSHGYYHTPMTMLTDAGLAFDIKQADGALFRAAHIIPQQFRAPYGQVDDRVKAALAREGYKHVHWDVAGWDWEANVLDIVNRATNVKDGDIILLHTWPYRTSLAIREVLRRLKAGYELTTVTRLAE